MAMTAATFVSRGRDQLEKRYAAGFSFTTSYVFSKVLMELIATGSRIILARPTRGIAG